MSQYSERRHLNPSLGLLLGEGSHQEVGPDTKSPSEVSGQIPSRFQDANYPTYYGKPVIKSPVWIWAVPAYFYVGGVAGGSMVLGAAAQISGGPGLRNFVKRCRWLATASAALGTGLLIHDLGRPGRFLYMLRVFRPSSPMSVGSWVLASAASLAGTSAVLSDGRGFLKRAGDAAGCAAGLLGMPLASYTAVLLANTAVPIWQESRRSLPLLFIGSAAASTSSALELMDLKAAEQSVVDRFAVAAGLIELASAFAVDRESSAVKRVGRPLNEGVAGGLWKAGKICSAVSLILSLAGGKSHPRRIASGILGTAGAVCFRFAIFHAGKASAADPRATFRQQRSGHGAAAVTGRAAISGPQE